MQTAAPVTLALPAEEEEEPAGRLREFLEWGAAHGARMHRHAEIKWADDASGWGLYVRGPRDTKPENEAAAAATRTARPTDRNETEESELWISGGEEIVRIPLSLVLDHRKASGTRVGRAVRDFVAQVLSPKDGDPRSFPGHVVRSLSKACILAVVVDQRFGQRGCACVCSRYTRPQVDGTQNCGSGHKDFCWHPYFRMMPDRFNTALEWQSNGLEHQQLNVLPNDERLRMVVQSVQEDADMAFDTLFPQLSALHPDLFPPAVFSRRHWHWAHSAYTSRVFPEHWVAGARRSLSADAIEGPGGAFLPLVDLLNHVEETPDQCCSVDWVRVAANEARESEESFALVAKRQMNADSLAKGVQIYNNYGSRDTAAWLTHYGFIPAAPASSCRSSQETVTISMSTVESPKPETQHGNLHEAGAPKKRLRHNLHDNMEHDSVFGVMRQLREHASRASPQISLRMLQSKGSASGVLPPQCRSLLRAARIHVATDAEFRREYSKLNPKSSSALVFAGPLCSGSSAHRPLSSAAKTSTTDAANIDVRALRVICRGLQEKRSVLQKVIDLDASPGPKQSLVSQWALRQRELVERAASVFGYALSATLDANSVQGEPKA